MKKLFFTLLAISFSSLFAGESSTSENTPLKEFQFEGHGPNLTMKELKDKVPQQSCYNLETTIVNLETGTAYNKANIPLCIHIGEWAKADDLECFDGFNYTADDKVYCAIRPNVSNKVVKITTPGYEFGAVGIQQSDIEHTDPSTSEPGIDSFVFGRGKKLEKYSEHGYWLYMLYDFYLLSNWDFRLQGIVANNSSLLPVQFSSIILPPLTFIDQDHPTNGLWINHYVQWKNPGEAPVSGNAVYSNIDKISALGIDSSNVEYNIEMKLVFDKLVF